MPADPRSVTSLPPGRHSLGNSLYLFVGRDGERRTWSVQVTRADRSKTFVSIGQHPAMSYTAARKAAMTALVDALREPVRPVPAPAPAASGEGIVSVTSTDVTLESLWAAFADLKLVKGKWTQAHHDKTDQRVRAHMGALLARPIATLSRAEIVRACTLESVETGGRIYRWLRNAVEAGLDAGTVDRTPFGAKAPEVLTVPAADRGTLRGNLSIQQLRILYQASWDSDATFAVRGLHRALALSGHRIGAARQARAEHLDLVAGIWRMPRNLMKVKGTRPDVILHMGPSLLALMSEAYRRCDGKGLLFKSPVTGEAVSEESVEHHLRKLMPAGGKHTPHSWRSSIMTWGVQNGFTREVSMAAIDHVRATGATRSYDESMHTEQVSRLLQNWAIHLENNT
jgi:hypothetical protein